MTDEATIHDLRALGAAFCIYGDFVAGAHHGSGHINDTFAVTYSQAGIPVRYILQRLNRNVFQNPDAVMENVRRVTAHLGSKTAGLPDASRRTLTLVSARDGTTSVRDAAGELWRCFLFIENVTAHDVLNCPELARKAAAAFGTFQAQLVDLPGGRLHETIPEFHNTVRRFVALERAVVTDSVGRVCLCGPEIEFALKNRALAASLIERQAAGLLPERITHNDTKLNNVMLDNVTGEGLCVIDLDTVMPGLALYDFGDLVRSAANPAAEDEPDLAKATLRLDYFAALVEGYLATAGAFLTPAEKECLALSSQVITFEVGLRFLTDFLGGDRYFRVRNDRHHHNLHRCRTQFKLAADIAAKLGEMNAIVEKNAR